MMVFKASIWKLVHVFVEKILSEIDVSYLVSWGKLKKQIKSWLLYCIAYEVGGICVKYVYLCKTILVTFTILFWNPEITYMD